MDFRLDRADDGARIILAGRLTFAENAPFRKVVTELADCPADEVVFDLGGVDYIDSAGLGLLLVAHETLAANGRRARLANVHGQVGRMIALARFGDFFTEI